MFKVAPEIGAQLRRGSNKRYLTNCLLLLNIIGTLSADRYGRIYSSRFLT